MHIHNAVAGEEEAYNFTQAHHNKHNESVTNTHFTQAHHNKHNESVTNTHTFTLALHAGTP